jgi:hypothetical protein
MGFGSGEGFTPGRNNLVGDFTVEGNISASAALSGAFFFGDGSFLQNVTGSGGGGGGNVTVGDSIDSGTGNRVLYENSSNKIAESANLTFNGTTLAAGATTVSTLSASSGITGSSLQISDGSRHYGMTNEGKLGIASFAANWTNAGNTVADLGTVTTATSITATDLIGTNVDGIIGADTARAGTFAAIVGTSLDVSDGNVANVGDLDCDTISVADAANGLDLQFGGVTTTNKISLTDDLADALNINEAGASYLKFTTSNGSEQIVVGKNSTFASTTIADLGTVTTATSITATDLIGTNVDGIIGADTARAGTFAAIVGTSLNVSDGNITQVGDINCDSVSVDDAAVGLDIAFGGATTLNKISLTDNLADALNINEGGTSYLKFVTTDGQEEIIVSQLASFVSSVTLGDADADIVTIKGVPSIEGVTNGADATLYFKADQGGEDAGDEWEFKGVDGGVFTVGNDINSAGVYVSQLTLTPHATVANSTTKVEGQLIADSLFVNQATEATLGNNTDALTIAQMLGRLATIDPNPSRSKATPTAAQIVAGITLPTADQAWDFTVINLAAGGSALTLTLTAGDGAVTLVGSMELNDASSATFRVRLTNVGGGSEAVTIYRIS